MNHAESLGVRGGRVHAGSQGQPLLFFLLNDVVLTVRGAELAPVVMLKRFRSLDFDFVRRLGQELYAEHPLLQFAKPERAKRLAALVMAKAPEINAALFSAPAEHCRPDEVEVRFAHIEIETMAYLYRRQQEGKLDAVSADRSVWKRLAA